MSLDLNDLWIGEIVEIISSQRIGTFEGINKGKARIKVNQKILLVKANNLKFPDQKSKKKDTDVKQLAKIENQVVEHVEFNTELDLHIEKLQFDKGRENPIAILEFQLRKLREYLDRAISLHIPKVTIIHGIGSGALKMEVHNILEDYPEIQSRYPTNQDGAVIVYFHK